MEIHYADLLETQGTQKMEFTNKTYQIQTEQIIQPRELLSFARQIAMGMVLILINKINRY